MKKLASWLLTLESFRTALMELGWSPPVVAQDEPPGEGGGGNGEEGP